MADIAKLSERIYNACKKASKQGWIITPHLYKSSGTKRCCILKAVEIAEFPNEDLEIEVIAKHLGLTLDESDFLMNGFDSDINDIVLENEFFEVGQKFRIMTDNGTFYDGSQDYGF